jgi:hypothetical protein
VERRQLHCNSCIGAHHPQQHLRIRSGPLAVIYQCSGSDCSQDILNNGQGLTLFNKLGAIFEASYGCNRATGSERYFHIIMKNDGLQKLQTALFSDAQNVHIVKRGNVADTRDEIQQSDIVV